MRILIIAAILVYASVALAEEFEVRVNRIEVGAAAPDESDDTATPGDKASQSDEGGITAEDDWESPVSASPPSGPSATRPVRSAPPSRSNARVRDVRDQIERCDADSSDNDCVSGAVDHNTTRSNR
jgi:hypothetical protein